MYLYSEIYFTRNLSGCGWYEAEIGLSQVVCTPFKCDLIPPMVVPEEECWKVVRLREDVRIAREEAKACV